VFSGSFKHDRDGNVVVVVGEVLDVVLTLTTPFITEINEQKKNNWILSMSIFISRNRKANSKTFNDDF
jgi:hypothetical protein